MPSTSCKSAGGCIVTVGDWFDGLLKHKLPHGLEGNSVDSSLEFFTSQSRQTSAFPVKQLTIVSTGIYFAADNYKTWLDGSPTKAVGFLLK